MLAAADIIRQFGGGDIFQYGDVNELTEKIINFYKIKIKQIITRNKNVINNNTWDNYGNRLYNFLNKI